MTLSVMRALILFCFWMVVEVGQGVGPQKITDRIWEPCRAVGIQFFLSMPIHAVVEGMVGGPTPNAALDAENLPKQIKEEVHRQADVFHRVVGDQSVAV